MKNLLLIIFSTLYAAPQFAQCVATSATSPSTSSNNTAIGSFSWSTTSMSLSSDDNYATAGHLLGVLSSANSNYLFATNFGFSIPSTATICGVVIQVEASCTGLLIGSSVTDNSVRLISGGAVTGTNKAKSGVWPGTDAISSYGGNGDLWGTTLTPAIVNAANFGIAISARMESGLASLFLTPRIDNIRMTIYYDNTAVPVKLKSFTARESAEGVVLDWVTATESGNKVFEIERSVDNVTWSQIGSIAGAGYSFTDKQYRFLDRTPNRSNFYRIKQVDFDNRSEYSKILGIKTSDRSSAIQVMPNPSSSFVTINGSAKITNVDFYNSNAIEVFPTLISAHSSGHTYDIKQLKTGLYFVNIQSGTGTVTRKIFVSR